MICHPGASHQRHYITALPILQIAQYVFCFVFTSSEQHQRLSRMYPSGSGNPRHLHNDISPRTSSSPFSRPECQNDRANMPDLIDELGLRDSSSPRSYQDGAYAIRPGGVSTPGQACRAPWQRDWREHKSEQVSPPSQSAKHPNTPHHAESDGARAPKHFKQPLECFYWHTFGYCTKSDDECL